MSCSPFEGDDVRDQHEGRWDGTGASTVTGHDEVSPQMQHPHLQGVAAGEAPQLAKARLEAQRAGEHMNWAVEQARIVDFQPGSLQMAEVAAADELYRKTRRHLSELYSREDDDQ